jgi:hypothetical protein
LAVKIHLRKTNFSGMGEALLLTAAFQWATPFKLYPFKLYPFKLYPFKLYPFKLFTFQG